MMTITMKKFVLFPSVIIMFALISAGCSGSPPQTTDISDAGDTVVQLPAISAGESSEVSEGIEPQDNVYPGPVKESAVEEVEPYPKPVVESASNVYPEPGNAAVEAETITLKTSMSATPPGQVELATGEPQVIEFFAYWCPTCQALAPTIHALEVEYYPEIKFSYLDIDNPAYDDFKQELGYRYQPHIFLLDGEGEIVEQWVGLVSEDVFRASLDELLNN